MDNLFQKATYSLLLLTLKLEYQPVLYQAFYKTYSKEEAERILNQVEFHYTPKHASWLNAAEIEINVMDIECTGRRIGDEETLIYEVAAWTKRRNDQKKKINWTFTKERAGEKLSEYYV